MLPFSVVGSGFRVPGSRFKVKKQILSLFQLGTLNFEP
jgi:hypothetical protein